MERKVGSSTVTAKEVKAALEKARTLSAEEEKVLRMRHGAGASSTRAPLPRAAGDNQELGDELLLIEMQLMKARGMPPPIPPRTRLSGRSARRSSRLAGVPYRLRMATRRSPASGNANGVPDVSVANPSASSVPPRAYSPFNQAAAAGFLQ